MESRFHCPRGVIVNLDVPKEIMSTKVSNMLKMEHEGNTPKQRQRLDDLRFQIGIALERAIVHTTFVELVKNAHLDY
jgi:hypothetical protein